jgi:hypothetical protein
MSSPLRIAVLVALTALMVSSAATTPAEAKGIHCEDAIDCPTGDICSIKPHHKTGLCVAIKKQRFHTVFCELDQDCSSGFCKIKTGHKTGVCASPKS